jgi:hypothetical protein
LAHAASAVVSIFLGAGGVPLKLITPLIVPVGPL